ncbi:HAAS signaling domain-containing protein [Streptomyces sp. 2A115]|uniref:HAAS signaling domain-containing protein n=1 Tax=Streptomyces sp. 2A115 TaxID=3457439 RepID=UPI003FD41F0D
MADSTQAAPSAAVGGRPLQAPDRRDPLVRAFLTEVDQRTRALPDDRRQELLADLSEHIGVTLTGSGTSNDEAVRRVLDQLGEPQAIADAALAEETGSRTDSEPDSPTRTYLTLALIVLPLPLSLVPAVGAVLVLATLAAGLVQLWKSAQWVRREKRRTTLLLLGPMVTVPVLGAAFSLPFGGLSAAALITALLLSWCLPVVGAARLARSAARLREPVA